MLAVWLVLILPIVTSAGPLEKRHQLELRLGMWNQVADARTEVSATGVSTSVGTNGFLGGFSYSHWLTEGTALNISLGVMTGDVSTDAGVFGVGTQTSTVTAILMGIKQYFPRSTYATSVRPYTRAAVGPFFGSQSSTNVGLSVTVESRSEVAFGGHLGTGVDFILGRHFAAGMGIGYNLMTDFDEPIGGSVNYSGPEFSLGFGYLFGRGVD